MWEKDAGTTIKWLGIGWGGSEIQELKFDSKNPVDKENSIWWRKIQNQMFMDSIKFYPRFKWIYRGFDCKKIDFLCQFKLLLEEIKVLGPIIILKSWFGQIRGLIA